MWEQEQIVKDDDEVRCPECCKSQNKMEQFSHILDVELVPGEDSNRPSTLIYFECEDGHTFAIRFSTHAGQTALVYVTL